MAKKHAISESYLRKLFMKHLHVSPKDYLTDIRMRHAERYLAYTSYTLRFIANACGFHDEFHFSKAFHKYKGVAPAEFRKTSKDADHSAL
ncbi:helix-turn-helix transcriptional regulator [Paenibacillus sp. FSL K6-1330]|uniref:helix-turn-helix transcriptional regulator n=1 Tax=Paenibacillus sp. FSL K6-1330 TaxID=2975292 RepID=UPI0030D8A546